MVLSEDYIARKFTEQDHNLVYYSFWFCYLVKIIHPSNSNFHIIFDKIDDEMIKFYEKNTRNRI